MKPSSLVFSVIALLLLAAPAAPAAAPPDPHGFTADQADPANNHAPDLQNLAWFDPSVTTNGELVVFLSGTGAAPKMYTRVVRLAAESGYHAIALDWPNGFDTAGDKGSNVFGPCGTDAACFGAARLEAFDGKDHTPKVTIGPADAVLGRLISALSYLDKTYPAEGWGAFLSGGQPDWSKIVIAGHSNGSGEAAFIATQVEVARVLMFSGPVNSTGSDPKFVAAPWMTGTIATPANRWYAFASKRDNKGALARVDREHVTWAVLGMEPAGGTPTSVDGASPPYGGAHALITDLPPCSGCTPHNMTAGMQTPLDASGLAVFRPVWQYMLGVSGTPAAAGAPATAPPVPVAATPAAADAGPADLPTPQVVQYQSDGLTLKAFLYEPPGAGPFPVYLWNHGSEQQPSFDKGLAKFWLGEGFAFFKPIRSGHGGNPGPYIVDAEKAVFAEEQAGKLTRDARNAAILALHARANEDVVNAYKWLVAQPFADPKRIVVGGGSYGGIQTLLTAEANAQQTLGIAAFVAMSPAAESWRPAWGDQLTAAIKAASGPILLAQARNDYNLGPTEVLGLLVDGRGAPSACWLFPAESGIAVKSDDPHAEGHSGFFADPTAWGATVVAYLKATGVAPDAPAPAASPLGAPVHCAAKESAG